MASSPAGENGRFVYALKVQWRVVWALILREMLTRYGRNNIGFLWLFLEPMLFMIAITVVWTAIKSVHGSNLPIVAFALTGYSAMLLWRNLPSRCIGAATANRSLLHHRQVKVLDIYWSRILLEQSAVTTSFVALGVVAWATGWLDPPEDALQVTAGWLLLAWFGAGLALAMAGLSDRFEIIEKLWPPTSLILFPLSGAAFIADALPPAAREIALYLPMLHAVEFIREGFFGSKMIAHYDLAYLTMWNLGLTLAGLSLVRLVGVDRGEE